MKLVLQKTHDQFWLATYLRVLLGLIDIYLIFYLFLLKIIINYKCPNMIGTYTYLDFLDLSNTWQFLIRWFNDTWHHLICFLIFNLVNLVTHVNLGFVTKFDLAISNWLSNFRFLHTFGKTCMVKSFDRFSPFIFWP